MGIFSRLAQLIKSNLNDLISRSEDPEKMLNQVVLDMNNQLVEAKKQVAASIADEKRLAKQFEQEAANAPGVGAHARCWPSAPATSRSRRRRSPASASTTSSRPRSRTSGRSRRPPSSSSRRRCAS